MAIYFEVQDDTIVNVVECDAEFAAENGLVEIAESEFPTGAMGRGAVRVDGVWRDKTREEKEVEVRQIRQKTLEVMIDPIVSNPIRWAELSTAQQNELKRIRTALLNMPSQAGWPWCDFPVWDQSVPALE